ncbi:hypothetical protein NQ318_009221 [Aromia moschata]|uniref:Amino acid transporter transmembrane domain-containing protein n=1 Tax=Aromia moschata TaxID=1265417 RepID=A0AAV8XPZ0_9CUCU|nr:hypothetical protein NQ318_009221 [Aromia moschata]
MDNQSGHVMTLANSIIGVSILAMPYCFKQCGIVLSVFILLISSIISRLACHFLLKSAIIARRKTFEFLAFHIFGSMGKLAIEIGIIGFLLGTCIAFFVVMGDLGPEIIAEMTGIYTTNTMRTSILMALALFCVLPSDCYETWTIIFEAVPHIFSGDWYSNVTFWRPAGIMQCLPIFSMALFCQTQLFEIYQALPNATLEKMNNVVRVAVNICTWVYIFVGIFGYIAFSHKQFTGNILLSFAPSLMTDVMKIGFVLSVAFSFPLVIFPCRASLYSLLYKEGYSVHEGMSNYIPEGKFKGLTMLIVFISLIVGIMIPNIELVLGLVGSTIGVMICVLFPVTCFICISPKNTNERILAQLMLMIGIFVMVLGTYKNLYSLDRLQPNTVTISSIKNMNQLDLNPAKAGDIVEALKDVVEKATTMKLVNVEKSIVNEPVKVDTTTLKIIEGLKEVRHEPPQPIEPQEEVEVKKVEVKGEDAVKPPTSLPVEKVTNKLPDKIPVDAEQAKPEAKPVKDVANESKIDEVDVEAIKRRQGILIDTIQKQSEVQKEIVEQQKKLLEVIQNQQKNAEETDIHKVNEEKVKAMKQIQSIALKAIEKIMREEVQKNIEAKVEQNVNEKVESNIIEIKIEQNEDKKESLLVQNQEGKPVNSAENKVDTGVKKHEQEIPVNKPEIIIAPRSNLGDIVANQENPLPLNEKKNVPELSKNVEPKQEKKYNIPETGAVANEGNEEKKQSEPKNVPIIKDQKNAAQPILNQNKSNENIVAKNKLSNPEPIDNNKAPPLSNDNVNNTAPLFLKLGKSEPKKPENELKKMVPLPLVVSINPKKEVNLSKVEPPVIDLKEAIKPQENMEQLQVIRRDILMAKARRR